MSESNDGVFKEINETANACSKVISETIRRILVPWDYINEELERRKKKPKTKNNREHFYDMYGSPIKSSSICDTDTYVDNLNKDTDFDIHSFGTSASHHSPCSDLSKPKTSASHHSPCSDLSKPKPSASHNRTTKQYSKSTKSNHSSSKCSSRRTSDSFVFSDVDTWVHDAVKECQK